jgi:transposase
MAMLEKALDRQAQLEAENRRLRERVVELEALVRLADDGSDAAKLRQRTAALEAQVASLTERLAEAQRAGRRQAAPFRRRKAKKQRKKPGRKDGHPGSYRIPPDQVDESHDQPLPACPHCQGSLEDLREYLNYVVEWPEVRAKIIEYVTHGGYCRTCRRRVRSRHPEQPSTASGAASVTLGPRALAIAASLHVRHGIAFKRAAELFSTLCGLPITPGGIALAIQRLGRRLMPTYQALTEALRVSEAVFADETGWRVLRATTWLWVFCNRDITVYVVDARKNHEVPLRVLGTGFVGVLHHDGARTYDTLPYRFHQTCLEHLLRDLDDLAGVKTAGAVRWPRAVAEVLRDALALRREHGVQTATSDNDASGQVEARIDRLLVADLTDPDNARMRARLARNRQMLFTFLYEPVVEGTNSRAERQMRPMIIGRKIGAGNRSWRGALAHQIVASIIATARQQGHCEVAVMTEAAADPAAPVVTRIVPAPPAEPPVVQVAPQAAPPVESSTPASPPPGRSPRVRTHARRPGSVAAAVAAVLVWCLVALHIQRPVGASVAAVGALATPSLLWADSLAPARPVPRSQPP